jgi:hypothetical protein
MMSRHARRRRLRASENARRQAVGAIDMRGTSGSLRRRRVIRAEFFLGAAGCTGLGALALATGAAG